MKSNYNPVKSEIPGVAIKELTTHTDERGFFREIIRSTDPFFAEGFGQWSMSLMVSGVCKAWHVHEKQTDWWLVGSGVLKAVICDRRLDSDSYNQVEEYLMGDFHKPIVLKIPPGVAHGCKVLQGPATLFYITSEVYNPADEGRLDYDALGYDWLKGPEIK